MALVLLSASVEICFVSRMRDFGDYGDKKKIWRFLHFNANMDALGLVLSSFPFIQFQPGAVSLEVGTQRILLVSVLLIRAHFNR